MEAHIACKANITHSARLESLLQTEVPQAFAALYLYRPDIFRIIHAETFYVLNNTPNRMFKRAWIFSAS
jgi:hypothetical protein